MAKRAHPEQQLHFAVADYLNAALPEEAWWTTVGHGGFALDARTGARMKRAGVKAGVPDILIIYEGCAYFFELKAPQGTLSSTQKDAHRAIEKASGYVAVIRSIGDLQTALRVIEIPLRARAA